MTFAPGMETRETLRADRDRALECWCDATRLADELAERLRLTGWQPEATAPVAIILDVWVGGAAPRRIPHVQKNAEGHWYVCESDGWWRLQEPVTHWRREPEAPGGSPAAGLVDLVSRFSAALLEKLRAAEMKYGFRNAWMRDGWRDECVADLVRHVDKGDPRDVAAYCAFAWHHGWSITPAATLPFQARVQPWLLECFGEMIAGDREERNHRFLEEALELVQSTGCTAHEAHQLVDYVFGRAVGEPFQEVGGVEVTLAALCLANGLDKHEAAEAELARINAPEILLKIRTKQAAKPKHSPLPEAGAEVAP